MNLSKDEYNDICWHIADKKKGELTKLLYAADMY